jgi:hypothetical protein
VSLRERLLRIYGNNNQNNSLGGATPTPRQIQEAIETGQEATTLEELEPLYPPTRQDIDNKTERVRRRRYNRRV